MRRCSERSPRRSAPATAVPPAWELGGGELGATVAPVPRPALDPADDPCASVGAGEVGELVASLGAPAPPVAPEEAIAVLAEPPRQAATSAAVRTGILMTKGSAATR